MHTSTALSALLGELSEHARSLGLTDTEWSSRAGVRKETLSRLRHRDTCDFATLRALAGVVGLQPGWLGKGLPGTTADGHFPTGIGRDYEAALADLCQSGSLDPRRWARLGPRFFMAGLAVMLASVHGVVRPGLLALAETLHPGASEPAVFDRWLNRSPLRPSRFLPLVGDGRPRAA